MASITHVADLDSGSSEYFSRADEALLSVTGNLTIELWVRLETAPSNSSFTFAHKWESTGDQRSYRFLYDDTGGTKTLRCSLSSAGTDATNVNSGVSATLSTGTWYHIAMVYTASSGSVEFFVDWVSQGTATGFPTSIFNSTQTLEIGRWGSTYYNGMMSLVRIWSTTRTVAQLKENANRVLGATSNLVGEWTLANTEADNSGNSFTLTNNSTVAYVTTPLPPIYVYPDAGSLALSAPAITPSLSQSVSIAVGTLTLTAPTISATYTARNISNVDKNNATFTNVPKS